MHNKVVVIGCGNVGMSYAYALLNQQTSVNELVLIDVNKNRVDGEVMDLNHCLAFAPSKIDIRCGDYEDCRDAKIVVIAAGASQVKGETRMDLIDKNSKIFKSIIQEVVKSGFKGIFLVATNPVDVMTYLTWKYSGFDCHRVLGSGTSLDTSRLRYLIGKKLGIGPKNIHAYVIGEHGDSEFVPWSNATVGLQNIDQFLSVKEKEEIAYDVKNAAYKIIDSKGATYYGIGMCLVYITNAILGNENTIITVSTYDKDSGVFVGLPTIVNKRGSKGKVYVDFTPDEREKLQHSIDVIKDAIQKVD
ncbi:MAG TPA: L-lactate dehydrogenase [Candidatus Faecimonas gallistercoris]|nr:L-lactate dehydrogenase [Candidatus Faecimonas gallistercoris]